MGTAPSAPGAGWGSEGKGWLGLRGVSLQELEELIRPEEELPS